MDSTESRRPVVPASLLRAENWFAFCTGPTAISPSAPTSYWDGLLRCCVTSGWPLNLSGHSSAQEGQSLHRLPPSLPASEA